MPSDDSSSKAKDRLNQVSSHLSSSSSSSDSKSNSSSSFRRSRSSSNKKSSLPADYSDILSQISTLQKLARTPNNNSRGYKRQKQSGKLWVRERVDALLDEGSLKEIGSISGTVKWMAVKEGTEGKSEEDGGEELEELKSMDGRRERPVEFVPSNNVQGFGTLDGRKICMTADDYSIRAGHADGAIWGKTLYMEKLALTLRIPMLKLVDGSSGGGSVTTIKKDGFSYIPPLPSFAEATAQLNAGIPNLGAVLGPAIGLGAARVTMCHFSVMAADIGSLFNAGPKVVAGATFEEDLTPGDLGGPDMHCRNGTIDNLALNEQDAFAQMRKVLTYLPDSGMVIPPVIASDDDPNRTSDSLRSIIPRRKERTYNPRTLITTTVDNGSFFEIGALWGTTAIVGLARLAGHPIGIVSLNCEVNAGALDAAGSQKITKHLKLCDVMNLPVLQFVDVPGYAIGTVAERAATMRHGVQLAAVYFTTTVPIFSVVVRRVYGVAGGAMLDSRDPQCRVAWPSGIWGSLPLEGGIEVGHSHELKSASEEAMKKAKAEGADDEEAAKRGKEAYEALYAELEGDYRRLINPVRTANSFGVEEIIDPAVTRPVVCKWVEHVYERLLPIRVMERASGKLQPQYA